MSAKSFGLTQAQVNGLTKYLDTRDPAAIADQAPLPAGLTAELIYETCDRLDGFPRHLGIHSGGMVIADRPLHEVVPIEWGRMEDRSVLQWDKDVCARSGSSNSTCSAWACSMLSIWPLTSSTETHGVPSDLATIPQEPVIYEMLTKADTVGVFQVESRAQMATLPRMKPKTFYDLAIEVALIRPGPIQGHSVHPFCSGRNGEAPITYPHPLPAHPGKDAGRARLPRAAHGAWPGCVPGSAGGQTDRLRMAMSSKRSVEAMAKLRDELYEGMAATGSREPPPRRSGRSCRGSPPSGSRKATR